MAEQGDLPEGWEELEPGFFVNTFRPAGRDGRDPAFDIPFSTTIVSVKSDSRIGAEWNNDPLAVIRRVDPDGRRFDIPDFAGAKDVHVMTLRINAELPANPKYTRSQLSGHGGSTRIVIVHYKDQRDYPTS